MLNYVLRYAYYTDSDFPSSTHLAVYSALCSLRLSAGMNARSALEGELFQSGDLLAFEPHAFPFRLGSGT
jgi:hypothetical protein